MISRRKTVARRWLATFVLLLALLGPASAQRYSFRHYGPDDGLKTSAISALLQDSAGFIWVGTGNGLYRYDGAHFQRFGKENGLSSDSIRFLHESQDKTLWLVTGKGLFRYKDNSFQLIEGNPDMWGFTAIESGGGKLYLGANKGLWVSDGDLGDHPHFVRLANTQETSINGIHVDGDGSIWFGCGKELCHLVRGKTEVLGAGDGLPEDRWALMVRDVQGNLWLRGFQHLYMQPAGSQRFVAFDRGLPPSTHDALSAVFDRAGHLMVSTDLGVAMWTGGKWQLIGSDQGLETDPVTAILKDREGSIWIGLWGAGLARWLGESEWTSWTKADGLSNSLVWAIKRHPNGDLWLGTDSGLVRLRSGTPPRVWHKQDGLGANQVKTLAITRDGTVWIGTNPGGVSRMDAASGRITTFHADSGLTEDRVIAIHLDREDRLWVATAAGLFRSTPIQGKQVRFERQVPPGTNDKTLFYRSMNDDQGRMWVTSLNGLLIWDHGQWTRLGSADGLKSDAVTHVMKTGDGAIWVGYREPIGLSRLDFSGGKLRVQHFRKEDGLPSDYILFLGLDAQHNLWVGTDDGVAVRSGDSWLRYDRDDGLIWADCAANAFLAEPDGGVWVGTLKGLSHYQPNHVAVPRSAVPVVITSARFGANSVTQIDQSPLSFRDRDFSVNFSALSYRHENKTRFRYRLMPLEDKWTETSQREARYASLPPGDYRFEVSARSSSGDWASPAALDFRVLPPWWRTWWAETLALLICSFAIVAFVRSKMNKVLLERRRLEEAVRERTQQLTEQNTVVEGQKLEIERLLDRQKEISRLKSEFLANMSHEIRTPMNGIIGMAQLALTTSLSSEQLEYVNTINTSGQSLLMVINDILDFSKIEAGKLELASEPFALRECLSETLRVFALKAQEKGIELGYCVRRDVPDVLIGDAGRLRQIVLNLVGNAMKFTDDGRILVDVTLADAAPSAGSGGTYQLVFRVQDTGMGIPQEKQSLIFDAFAQADSSTTRTRGGTGLGLAICTKLVHLMQGRIWVESTAGTGSEFFFTARFPVAPQSELVPGTGLSKLPDVNLLIVEPKGRTNSYLHELVAEWSASGASVSSFGEAVAELERNRGSSRSFNWIIFDGSLEEFRKSPLPQALLNCEHSPRVILLESAALAYGKDSRAGLPENIFVLASPLNARELHAYLSRGENSRKVIPQKKTSLPRAQRSLRILLAEDNHVNQVLACRLLEKMGHAVIVAENGVKAVAAAAQDCVDVILMDVQMPEMDGLEATRTIRQAEAAAASRHIPIVAMTAHAMSGDRERCLNAGMDAYVSKPIDALELYGILEKISAALSPFSDAASDDKHEHSRIQ